MVTFVNDKMTHFTACLLSTNRNSLAPVPLFISQQLRR